ncbi:hypothetical protein SAMN00017405_1818 [Desulfonispora thiosulfatigenes DSM 11270]|uniref:DUF5320 domain-containing protein n=1 Tax=Desulfonispora thiosulfatigenes DSM 11270 TaxID=656914 RepID=A0A1W1V3Y3_DESTI|nr:DUF5320 domain-containing protein [Desulfonispora thiosulfatigenes]SMB88028.1 hypothetical protein SAMN00017405_1818 [Desulfonispora thiosulfatigenes DSM 11270]
MPRGDGTGPLGQGTMSGKGRGNCISDNFNKNKPGRGMGMGRGICKGNKLWSNQQNTSEQNKEK